MPSKSSDSATDTLPIWRLTFPEWERDASLGRVPERYLTKTLDNFDPTVSPAAAKALEAAKLMAGGLVGHLLLIGRPGAGKSHLAAGVVAATAAQRATALSERLADAAKRQEEIGEAVYIHVTVPEAPLWCNVPALLADLRLQLHAQESPARFLLEKLRAWPELVVLDDLGREKASEWTAELIYVTVNDRYERALRTVVTSNLTVAELEANGYGAVVSRLAEDGRLVEMASAIDYRTRR